MFGHSCCLSSCVGYDPLKRAGAGGGFLLYIFLPVRPSCPTRKKSTFINLPRDICAHNFRDPAIKLRPERELGVGYTISRYFICCLILSI